MKKNDTWVSPYTEYEKAAIRLALHEMLIQEASDIENAQIDAESDTSSNKSHDQLIRSIVSKSKAIHRTKNVITKLPKVLQIAVLILLLCNFMATLAFAGSHNVRAHVMQYFETTYSTHTTIGFIESDNILDIPSEWEAPYYPTYIPDGFSIDSLWSDKKSVIVSYTNQQGQVIKINISDINGVNNINTENRKEKEIVINQTIGKLYYNDNGNFIVWHEGGNSIVLFSNLPIGVCYEIAESITLIDY